MEGRRKSIQSTLPNASLENEPTFDKFFILGAEPSKIQNAEPVVLLSFPSSGDSISLEELGTLSKLSFPNGFKCERKEFSSESENLCSLFTFHVNEGNNPRFAVCCNFHVDGKFIPFFGTSLSRDYPFAFCMVTRKPIIATHYEFLRRLVSFLCGGQGMNFDKNYVSRPVGSPIAQTQPYQKIDRSYVKVAVHKDLNCDEYCYNLLNSYHSNCNYNCASMHFSCSRKIPLCNVVDPRLCMLVPHVWALVTFLTPKQLIALYTWMILERRILFISKFQHRVSASILALSSLLDPKLRRFTVFPVIPEFEEFSEVFHLPTPYIGGCCFDFKGSDVTVDLDSGKITSSVKLPHIPHSRKLEKKIREIYKGRITVPKKIRKRLFRKGTINKDYLKFVNNTPHHVLPTGPAILEGGSKIINEKNASTIMETFDAYLNTIIQDICSLASNRKADAKSFVNFVPREHVEFFRIFSESGVFSRYFEGD